MFSLVHLFNLTHIYVQHTLVKFYCKILILTIVPFDELFTSLSFFILIYILFGLNEKIKLVEKKINNRSQIN